MKSIPSKFCKWFELTPDKQNEIRLRGDMLTIQQIGEFMYHSEINRKERLKLYRLLVSACERGTLKHRGDITNWQVKYDEINKKVGSGEFYELTWENCWEVTNPPNCKIHKDDLKRYLQSIDLWPVENCLLSNWWANDEPSVEDYCKMKEQQLEPASVKDEIEDQTDNGRRNDQIDFIIKTTKELKYDDLLNIPEGGRAKIKENCLKNKSLFTESGFKRAWTEAGNRGLIRMKDKQKYLKNQ